MGIHNAGVATHNQRTNLTFIASKAPKANKTDIAATLPEKETKRAPVLGILGSRCHLLCRRAAANQPQRNQSRTMDNGMSATIIPLRPSSDAGDPMG